MDCCWLCGIDLHGKRRRYQDAKKLQEGIRERTKPTPYVQAWLASRPLEAEREPLCVACTNWYRRICNGTLRRNRRPMVQLDQLMLYLLNPGKCHEPDARCMDRLVRAARQPTGNGALHVFPLPALEILGLMQGTTAEAGLLAWWDYNDRTEFFSNAEAAKRVRAVLKRREPCVAESLECMQ